MISPEKLRRFAHCAGAPDDLLKQVAMIAEEKTYAPGETVFREGDSAVHLMFLESGKVDILYRLGDNREVVVDSLAPGETMAWSALLEPHRLTGTGVARKESKVVRIDGERLRAICHSNPDYGLHMMTEVAKTLRDRLTATRVQLAAAG
jgi:CRP/FNR family cyclic AMP-dependent transcriptional regulator